MGLDKFFRAKELKMYVNRAVTALEAIANGVGDRHRWTQLEKGPDGVAVTLYEDSPEYIEPAVVDQAWWTWEEFCGMDQAAMAGGEPSTVTLGLEDESEADGDGADE